MPIKEIRHYAELRAAGDPTLSERMEMLVQHRQALDEQIAQLQAHKIKLDENSGFTEMKLNEHRIMFLPKYYAAGKGNRPFPASSLIPFP